MDLNKKSEAMSDILKNIYYSRKLVGELPNRLRVQDGYKYTINHDVKSYPAAQLYGTWSVAYIRYLVLGKEWNDDEEKEHILKSLNRHRTEDGLFFPKELDQIDFPKSREYMMLHCYNYSVGAALILDSEYDFQSKYMDHYLNADHLCRWLNQRSLERPWEESNNIVNVASYLALCNDHGDSRGKEGLYQMLEWHNRVQNPRTGGFELFPPTRKNILQSMAGAVHNFHIHHYLNEPMRYERLIGQNMIPFLFEGPLTACLSIDFVELACKALPFMEDSYELENALLYHLNSLIEFQNIDGGFYENESASRPTKANGMKEQQASSNSYATWFRLCSMGMIATALLGDKEENWNFRDTLGMGYYRSRSTYLTQLKKVDQRVQRKYLIKNLPSQMKSNLIAFGVNLFR